MISGYFYRLLSGYFWALTTLFNTTVSFLRHPFTLFTSEMPFQNRAEQKRVQEQANSMKQSLCASADASNETNPPRINVLEGVTAADDAEQIFVSTNNNIFSIKQVTAKVGARQWVGQMNDASLQQLLQGGRVNRATKDEAIKPEIERSANFVQYGKGYRLEGVGK